MVTDKQEKNNNSPISCVTLPNLTKGQRRCKAQKVSTGYVNANAEFFKGRAIIT